MKKPQFYERFYQKRYSVKKRQETALDAREEFATKSDLKQFKEEIIHEFHIIAEGLTDHMKLLADGHSGLAQRLDRVEIRIDGVETRLDRTEVGFPFWSHRSRSFRNGENRLRND